MPKLKPVSFKVLVLGLKNFGFNGPFSGGKHLFMIKNKRRLIIPNPHRKEISADLLQRILKQADIERSDWIKITQSGKIAMKVFARNKSYDKKLWQDLFF